MVTGPFFFLCWGSPNPSDVLILLFYSVFPTPLQHTELPVLQNLLKSRGFKAVEGSSVALQGCSNVLLLDKWDPDSSLASCERSCPWNQLSDMLWFLGWAINPLWFYALWLQWWFSTSRWWCFLPGMFCNRALRGYSLKASLSSGQMVSKPSILPLSCWNQTAYSKDCHQ